MKFTSAAGLSAAGTGISLAGLSIASDQVGGWLDVAGQVLDHPRSLVLLAVLVAMLLVWLLIRCHSSEAALRLKFDRLQRAVFLALTSDDPSASEKIIANWDGVIDGTLKLDDLLGIPQPERRRRVASHGPPA